MTEPLAAADAAAQPEVKGGVVAYLQLDGALKAAELYARAFGAVTVGVHPPDEQGRTVHVHLHLNDGSLMLSDPFPEHDGALAAPGGFSLMLPVGDADAWHDRAVAAGCASVLPPQDMFWGDRYAQVRDPFGVLWAFNQAR